MPFPPRTGPFAGMAVAQLQASLASAQAALITLETGGQVATVAYAQGEGNRQVTYRAADSVRLRRLIADLQAALGLTRRRAIGVSFT